MVAGEEAKAKAAKKTVGGEAKAAKKPVRAKRWTVLEGIMAVAAALAAEKAREELRDVEVDADLTQITFSLPEVAPPCRGRWEFPDGATRVTSPIVSVADALDAVIQSDTKKVASYSPKQFEVVSAGVVVVALCKESEASVVPMHFAVPAKEVEEYVRFDPAFRLDELFVRLFRMIRVEAGFGSCKLDPELHALTAANRVLAEYDAPTHRLVSRLFAKYADRFRQRQKAAHAQRQREKEEKEEKEAAEREAAKRDATEDKVGKKRSRAKERV